MKVLVISHNVFSYSENMGKTLANMFSGFQEDEIFQLYFHSEIPTVEEICSSYYRITDRDALKSIVNRKHHGIRFSNYQVRKNVSSSRIDTGIIAKVYQKGRKRTPVIYLARDLLWSLSNWFNKDLKSWLSENKPEVIFYAAGDYSFSYKIVNKISEYLQIPIIVYCVDDYYLFNTNEKRFLGKFRQKLFMKNVKKTIEHSEFLITICDKMADDYRKLFNKECHVLYTTAEDRTIDYYEERKRFAYFGSLGVNRDFQLIDIGKAVANTAMITGICTVDVFTSEKRPEVLERMKNVPGISIHSAVSQAEMNEILRSCVGVIHTESYDEIFRKRVRYSVSTKIAESLMYGPCLFAYGPKEVASIEYLRRNKVAYVVTEPEKLKKGIIEFLTDKKLRQTIEKSARKLAKNNHSSETNVTLLYGWLKNTVKEPRREEKYDTK